MSPVTKTALKNALATAGYVVAVGIFMFFGATIKIGRSNSFLLPITILLLLVFSASFTGFLIFGKPAQMYVDGKKKEALALLTQTLIFFFCITFCALVLMVGLTR
jgi:hypothetical protein